MSWIASTIHVKAPHRGLYLITDYISECVPEISNFCIGSIHLFINHTSASLTINENADPTVLSDMEHHFNNIVPENAPYYEHTYEGSDDMPAHIKSTMVGCELTIPIIDGRMNLGHWQGIYLYEHRDIPRTRNITVTVNGKKI